MIGINVGDIQGRLVRALGLRGKIPLTLDENVVPVALALDATNPMFAQSVVECMQAISLTGAVGALRDQFFQNNTQGLVARIKQLVIQNTGAAVNLSLWIERNAVKFGASFGGAQLNTPTAQVGTNKAAIPQLQNGITTSGHSANATLIGQYLLPASSMPIVIPLDVVLYFPGNPANADRFLIEIPDAVGNNFEGSVHWQEYGPL